jgi:GWxTD domain-containing protein
VQTVWLDLTQNRTHVWLQVATRPLPQAEVSFNGQTCSYRLFTEYRILNENSQPIRTLERTLTVAYPARHDPEWLSLHQAFSLPTGSYTLDVSVLSTDLALATRVSFTIEPPTIPVALSTLLIQHEGADTYPTSSIRVEPQAREPQGWAASCELYSSEKLPVTLRWVVLRKRPEVQSTAIDDYVSVWQSSQAFRLRPGRSGARMPLPVHQFTAGTYRLELQILTADGLIERKGHDFVLTTATETTPEHATWNHAFEPRAEWVLQADQRFSTAGRRGAHTERGKTWLELGPPDRILQVSRQREVWFYESTGIYRIFDHQPAKSASPIPITGSQ